MENESFRERNRRRREESAFENLYAYASKAKIPSPKRAAERTARLIHGGQSTSAQPSHFPEPGTDKVPHRLEDRTKEQLYERAQQMDIQGRSQMTKDELIAAIRCQQ